MHAPTDKMGILCAARTNFMRGREGVDKILPSKLKPRRFHMQRAGKQTFAASQRLCGESAGKSRVSERQTSEVEQKDSKTRETTVQARGRLCTYIFLLY